MTINFNSNVIFLKLFILFFKKLWKFIIITDIMVLWNSTVCRGIKKTHFEDLMKGVNGYSYENFSSRR